VPAELIHLRDMSTDEKAAREEIIRSLFQLKRICTVDRTNIAPASNVSRLILSRNDNLAPSVRDQLHHTASIAIQGEA